MYFVLEIFIIIATFTTKYWNCNWNSCFDKHFLQYVHCDQKKKQCYNTQHVHETIRKLNKKKLKLYKHKTDTYTTNTITKLLEQVMLCNQTTDMTSIPAHEAKTCSSDRRTRYFEHCHACEHQKRNNNLVPQFCSNISATIVFTNSVIVSITF